MTITLKNGRQFQIDEQDWEKVKCIKWNVHMMKKGYKYVYTFQKLNEERKMLAKKSRFLTNAPNSVFQLGEFLALPKRVEMPRPPKRSNKLVD